jgi:hypothetical protein
MAGSKDGLLPKARCLSQYEQSTFEAPRAGAAAREKTSVAGQGI